MSWNLSSYQLRLGLFFVCTFSLWAINGILGSPLPAFILAPVLVLIVGTSPLLVLSGATCLYILFFDPARPLSLYYRLSPVDTFLAAWISALWILKNNRAAFTIPVCGLSLSSYALVLIGIMGGLRGFLNLGLDAYVIGDTRNVLYLLLLPILSHTATVCLKAQFRIWTIMLLWISITTLLHGTHSLVSGVRLITWNEPIFGYGMVIAAGSFSLVRDKAMRVFLVTAGILSFVGLLATQTRAAWAAGVAGLLLCLLLQIRLKTLFTRVLPGFVAALFFLFASITLLRVIGFDMIRFMAVRLTQISSEELVSPNASLGFRIYEALNVLKDVSLFGHGAGARLFIYIPWANINRFVKWWYIHSEYFEVLHKYGILGLFTLLVFFSIAVFRSVVLSFSSSRGKRAIGRVSSGVIVTTMLLSVTSGYLTRPNTLLILVAVIAPLIVINPNKHSRITPHSGIG